VYEGSVQQRMMGVALAARRLQTKKLTITATSRFVSDNQFLRQLDICLSPDTRKTKILEHHRRRKIPQPASSPTGVEGGGNEKEARKGV